MDENEDVEICKLCEKELADKTKKPMFLTVFGEDKDKGQCSLTVCKSCFLNKPKEIFKKIETGSYD